MSNQENATPQTVERIAARLVRLSVLAEEDKMGGYASAMLDAAEALAASQRRVEQVQEESRQVSEIVEQIQARLDAAEALLGDVLEEISHGDAHLPLRQRILDLIRQEEDPTNFDDGRDFSGHYEP